MNILLVTHYYSTHHGGIEMVAGQLASRLARDRTVTWAASDCDPIPTDDGDAIRCVPMRANNTIERTLGLPFPVWGPRSLIRLWRETASTDVVHIHDFTYLGNLAAVAFAAILRKPVLVTQHVGFIPYRNPFLRGLLRVVHATAGRVALGRAAQVIFVSGVVRRYYERFVSFRRPPVVVWNGVETDVFAFSSFDQQCGRRQSLGLDPAKPVLLFVGRFVEKKGMRLLEQLVARMRDVSWIFVGWGPIDPRAWREPHVQVIAERRGAELVGFYQLADLLVLPSVGEGLPLVVQEAMSTGTPVIVGEDTAQAIDAPDGLVFSCRVDGKDSVQAWEVALRRLLSNREVLASLRPRVSELARSRWSWATCAARYGATLDELASGTREP